MLFRSNITIDGTEIDLSSGDLTLDVAGDIILDADGANVTVKDGGTTTLDIVSNGTTDVTLDAPGDIILDADGGNVTFKDGGTSILDIANSSTDVEFTVSTADKNFAIKGTDGSSAITALDIDMALNGGEDYELVFTGSSDVVESSALSGFNLTEIGKVVIQRDSGPLVTVLNAEGNAYEPSTKSWDHLNG